MSSFISRGTAACVLTVPALAGCAGFPAHQHEQPIGDPAALRECPMAQPGRTNRRLQMPATSPGVAACLKRHGWDSDATPLDAVETSQ